MDQALTAARAFLRDRYGSTAGPPSALGAGAWSRAYAFTLDGRQVVVRFGGYREDFEKDRVMARYSRAPLPIPAVLEVGEAPEGYFAVSQRAFGVPLDSLDGEGMRAVLPSLLTALDAIAAIDTSGSAGFGLWTPEGRAPHRTWREALLAVNRERDRIRGWRPALEASPTGARPFDHVYAALVQVGEGLPEPRQIIHSDLLYHNVLVEGERVSAVLDWGNALYGDALYDAAWLIFWWPWYPEWAGIDVRGALRGHWQSTPPDLERRLLAYQLHIGLDSMAYTAYVGRWDDLARLAAQTLALIKGTAGTR